MTANSTEGKTRPPAQARHGRERRRRREPLTMRGARCTAPPSRARHRGVVLPIVLLVSALMLATSAVWFETSLAAARSTSNVLDDLQAFHAADSALTLCARSVLAAGPGADGEAPQPDVTGEPVQWKMESAFVAGANTPVAQWPGSQRAPQCLIEPWRLASRVGARAFLITARGFGRSEDAQVWLQMQVVIDGETVERHWRRVAARPF